MATDNRVPMPVTNENTLDFINRMGFKEWHAKRLARPSMLSSHVDAGYGHTQIIDIRDNCYKMAFIDKHGRLTSGYVTIVQ
jgi:hypothetical protein